VTIRPVLGAGRRRILCWIYQRRARLGSDGPIVSFAFDDFPRTALTTGGAILKSFGARGTYYVAMGLMNTSNALGEQFTADDLFSAAADGHELASHTFSHVSSRQVPLRVFLEEVRKGRGALAQVTMGAAGGHFAYPFGDITLAAKRAVGREMRSCRSTCGGVNGSLVDLNLLRANSLYGGVDRLSAVRRLLEENEDRRGWLIFYTHDVRPNPSSFGCTPKLLELTVELALKRAAKVIPVAQAIAQLSVPDPSPDKQSASVTAR
jgi:peptidoglycan/xylan/chitin deacetylase (PgdA/CDA1 family)